MKTLKMLAIIMMISLAFVGHLSGQSYENTFQIFDDLLNSSVYKPQVRPISDQSQAVNVSVDFNLVSIVTVDDSTESFICNGFMVFRWLDERLQWNPSDYGNQYMIHPYPKEIWRPRVVLINTRDEMDLFADDINVLFVYNNGSVLWSPGNLFTTSCSLNLQKYPFDEQQCNINMYSMGLSLSQLRFEAGRAPMTFYTVNGEWDLLDIWVETTIARSDEIELSVFKVQFRMKRRPTFYLLNIILPAVILSVLNLLVFSIPQESGEKIGYGITVLLALSVFFSIIGGMLPRSSNIVPFLVIYLFMLYLISSLAVLDSILISYIYHIDEKQEKCKRFGNVIVKFAHMMQRRRRNTIFVESADNTPTRNPLDSEKKTMANQYSETLKRQEVGESSLLEEKELDRQKERERETEESPLDTKALAGTMDCFSAVVFLAVWVIVTLWFFVSVVS